MTCRAVPKWECTPSKFGYCVRCGQLVVESESATPVLRSLRIERQFVEEAARGVCDPSALIEHAQMRALHLSGEYVIDPMTIRPKVDRKRERREELVDFVNHCLFDAEEHPEDMELWQELQILVRGAALLYDRLLED